MPTCYDDWVCFNYRFNMFNILTMQRSINRKLIAKWFIVVFSLSFFHLNNVHCHESAKIMREWLICNSCVANKFRFSLFSASLRHWHDAWHKSEKLVCFDLKHNCLFVFVPCTTIHTINYFILQYLFIPIHSLPFGFLAAIAERRRFLG